MLPIAKKNTTKSNHADLVLPVRRVEKIMKKTHGQRMGNLAAVKATAATEFYIREIVTEAIAAAASKKRTRISTNHVQQAIRNNPELREIARNISIADSNGTGYILPHNKKTNKQQQVLRRRERKQLNRAAAAAAAAVDAATKADGDDDDDDDDDEYDESEEASAPLLSSSMSSDDEDDDDDDAAARPAKKAKTAPKKSAAAAKKPAVRAKNPVAPAKKAKK